MIDHEKFLKRVQKENKMLKRISNKTAQKLLGYKSSGSISKATFSRDSSGMIFVDSVLLLLFNKRAKKREIAQLDTIDVLWEKCLEITQPLEAEEKPVEMVPFNNERDMPGIIRRAKELYEEEERMVMDILEQDKVVGTKEEITCNLCNENIDGSKCGVCQLAENLLYQQKGKKAEKVIENNDIHVNNLEIAIDEEVKKAVAVAEAKAGKKYRQYELKIDILKTKSEEGQSAAHGYAEEAKAVAKDCLNKITIIVTDHENHLEKLRKQIADQQHENAQLSMQLQKYKDKVIAQNDALNGKAEAEAKYFPSIRVDGFSPAPQISQDPIRQPKTKKVSRLNQINYVNNRI